jgi:hypothetical protein
MGYKAKEPEEVRIASQEELQALVSLVNGR